MNIEIEPLGLVAGVFAFNVVRLWEAGFRSFVVFMVVALLNAIWRHSRGDDGKV